jgi:putative lipoic acid-binding regulatory protein
VSIDDEPERDFTSPEEAPPKIEFPCLYPIKVIGHAVDTFQAQVLETIERHSGAIDPNLIQLKPSKHSNYLSITVTIAATGEPQLQSIFSDLKEIESVKLVL